MGNYKITYGRNTEKLTDEIHRERIYNAHNGNIVPLTNYVNNRTLVRYKCLKHNIEWDGRPTPIMAGQTGCSECKKERRIEISSDTLDSLKEKISKKYGNEYEIIDTEYIGWKHKMHFRHNLPDGSSHTVYSYPGRILNKNSGCPVCAGSQISKGYNDIATTDPEVASWFVNIEDTFKYGRSSNKKVDFRCPTCKTISNKLINQVSRDRDIRCPICKDGISYPNKFIFNALLQIENKLDFLEREYHAEWCKFLFKGKERSGIYDIYFGINGKGYIIEMDGGFHYRENNLNGFTIEDIQFIDSEKTRLAIENNISLIRIDCNYPCETEKYSYIKSNIDNSELSKIIPYELIDFDSANIKSQKSYLIEACKMWDDGCTAGQIIDKLRIDKTKVSVYLKIGQQYGICHNYSRKESRIRTAGRKVICINTKEIFMTIQEAEQYYEVNGIGKCCKGKVYSAGKHKKTKEKLFWMFYDEYEKMSDEDIENYIKQKNKYALESEVFGKIVVCITTNKIFKSYVDAAKYYNAHDSGIIKCCNGEIKTSGKLADGTRLEWMYYKDYIEKYGESTLLSGEGVSA